MYTLDIAQIKSQIADIKIHSFFSPLKQGVSMSIFAMGTNLA
jgi:hypothetical protein